MCNLKTEYFLWIFTPHFFWHPFLIHVFVISRGKIYIRRIEFPKMALIYFPHLYCLCIWRVPGHYGSVVGEITSLKCTKASIPQAALQRGPLQTGTLLRHIPGIRSHLCRTFFFFFLFSFFFLMKKAEESGNLNRKDFVIQLSSTVHF